MSDAATRASARLYLPEEAVATALERGSVRETFRPRPVPSLPVRVYQRLSMKAGRLTYERSWLDRVIAARRDVLGAAAAGPPRFLVRVDEFPHYLAVDSPARYGVETARRFHEIMSSAGVAHLMAIVPEPASDPLNTDETRGRRLDADELEHLARMQDDGVVLAQHGTTHRTRHREPRRRSELAGLDAKALAAQLDRGLALLEEAGVRPEVFVPPFNRFDASQWQVLAERYAVVCGGPENVKLLGFHGTPLFRGRCVYLPAYPPLYGTAQEALPAVERLIAEEPGVWIPLVLHLGWEADEGWGALGRLVARLAPYAADWREFLAAAGVSREAELAA